MQNANRYSLLSNSIVHCMTCQSSRYTTESYLCKYKLRFEQIMWSTELAKQKTKFGVKWSIHVDPLLTQVIHSEAAE